MLTETRRYFKMLTVKSWCVFISDSLEMISSFKESVCSDTSCITSTR